MTKLVRIYPYNPTQGYKTRRILLSGSGYPMFTVDRGWYEVDDKTAKRLAKLKNNPNYEHSRPVFQVCTKDEAVALEEAEQEIMAAAAAPVPMPKAFRQEAAMEGYEPSPNPTAEKVKAPAFIETADPDDPEDHIEWPDDEDEEETPVAKPVEPPPPPKPVKKAKKRAKRKTKKRAKRKTKKKTT